VPADPNPLEKALFRTTDDGRLIYFPWGLTSRGFRLPDADAKKPAIRAASILLVAVLAIATWTAEVLQPFLEAEPSQAFSGRALIGPTIALAVVVVGYYWWTARYVEDLPESSFKISRQERLREAARLAEPWKVVAVGAITVVLSLLLVWLRAGAAWLGLAGFLVGVGLIWWGLLLKRSMKDDT
jgi:hypothetical protein